MASNSFASTVIATCLSTNLNLSSVALFDVTNIQGLLMARRALHNLNIVVNMMPFIIRLDRHSKCVSLLFVGSPDGAQTMNCREFYDFVWQATD